MFTEDFIEFDVPQIQFSNNGVQNNTGPCWSGCCYTLYQEIYLQQRGSQFSTSFISFKPRTWIMKTWNLLKLPLHLKAIIVYRQFEQLCNCMVVNLKEFREHVKNTLRGWWFRTNFICDGHAPKQNIITNFAVAFLKMFTCSGEELSFLQAPRVT